MNFKSGKAARDGTLPGPLLGLGPYLFLAWSVVSVAGCGREGEAELPSHGLMKVEVTLPTDSLGRMHADLFTRPRFVARIKIRGEKETLEGKARVRYSGQYTLLSPKKSLDLRLEKPLRWRGKGRTRLLGQPTDTSSLRNPVGYRIFAALGFPVPELQHVFLYVNGAPRGLYLLSESLTGDFLRERGIGFATLYQAKLGVADFSLTTPEEQDEVFEPEHGDGNNTDLVRFLALLQSAKDPSDVRALEEVLDVDGFLRYLAGCTFLRHWDGQANNFYLYREKRSNLFKVIPWDLDKIWTVDAAPDGSVKRDYSPFVENVLSRKLHLVPEYKARYLGYLAFLRREFPASRLRGELVARSAGLADAWSADRAYAQAGVPFPVVLAELGEGIRTWLGKIAPLTEGVSPIEPTSSR